MEKKQEENKYEGLFIIGYGLAGGFGGARDFEVIQTDTLEAAEKWAWENACEEYERYAGSNGLREIGEIMEEEGIEDEDEAYIVFEEEREGWLDYSARPYSKEYEKQISGNHYNNPYKEITDN
jgi:hypothetical protein